MANPCYRSKSVVPDDIFSEDWLVGVMQDAWVAAFSQPPATNPDPAEPYDTDDWGCEYGENGCTRCDVCGHSPCLQGCPT